MNTVSNNADETTSTAQWLKCVKDLSLKLAINIDYSICLLH